MRFEFLGAPEQFGATGPALVDTFGLGVGVLADEGPLGARFAQDGVFGGGELLAPPSLVSSTLGRGEVISPR